jgi:serine/threonine-protein kinase
LDGRYHLEEAVGRGGYATVYRATQLNLGQTVAVKLLDVSGPAQETAGERFLREAKAAAQLSHPGIVRVLDFGMVSASEPFLVMEFLEGKPLYVLLREEGSLGVRRALRLFVPCLDALQSAHALGILHRDLKPANLFVTWPGSVSESLRLLDFGCAILLEESRRLTGHDVRLGTPNYLAPEYILHNTITPALDVYQMGLILVECLTGRRAVANEAPLEAVRAHCIGDLDLPQELLESALGPILHRAIHPNHAQRFQNAGEFRDALRAVNPDALPERFAAPAGLAQSETTPSGRSLVSRTTERISRDNIEAYVSRAKAPQDTPTALAPNPPDARAVVKPTLPAAQAEPPRGLASAHTERMEPPAKRRGLPLVPLGALVLLGSAAVGWAGWTALASDEAPSVQAQAQTQLRAQGKRAKAAPAVVRVKAVPKTASIYQGKRLLGFGEVEVEVEGGAQVEVVVQEQGYVPRALTLKASDGPQEVALKPAPQGSADAKADATPTREDPKPAVKPKAHPKEVAPQAPPSGGEVSPPAEPAPKLKIFD